MKHSKELFSIILLAVLILTIQYNGLLSDYIRDAEEKTAEVKKPEEDKFSRNIARNIRVEIIPNIKSAVRISWDLHKNSDDDYIVGRSLTMPDTMEKALKSISIKVVPAGAKTEVIDSDLKAGTYYYCVLAKSAIIDRDIKLHAGQNYTTDPAVIELAAEPEKAQLPQVSLIYARIVNNNQVRISWRGAEGRGVIYSVYRGTAPLDSPAKFSQAEKIKEIADGSESCIDGNIYKTGTYFYAVTTKPLSGNENFNLMPDQNYTVSGIFISLEVPAPVKNISASTADEGVRISWQKTSTGVSEYLIYRSSGAISDQQRMSLSTLLGRASESEDFFLDRNPPDGNFYYAVLTKFLNGKVLNDLIKGDNYTVEPVVLGSPIQLLSFTGRPSGRNVELAWKTSGNLGNKNYKIIRKDSIIRDISDLEEADLVANINIGDLGFTDKNLNQGKYYYAILPKSAKDKEYALKDGINVIEKGVVIGGKTAAAIPAPEETPEKSEVVPRPSGKKEQAAEKTSNVDQIIQKYFLAGKHRHTLNELENFIARTNNKQEAAKARLFMGRSLIELKRYREAVLYLVLKDVNDYYPKEAEFWRDFALSRIPDKKVINN